MSDSIEQRLRELEETVRRHKMIVWFVGIVGGFFGVGGGLGVWAISNLHTELESTRSELTELQSRVKKTKRDFAAYFTSRKREFSDHVAAETEKAVQILEKKGKTLVGRRLTEAARREIADLQAELRAAAESVKREVARSQSEISTLTKTAKREIKSLQTKIQDSGSVLPEIRAANIKIVNGDGKVVLSMGSDISSNGFLNLYRNDGTRIVFIGASTDDNGGIWLSNKEGKEGVLLVTTSSNGLLELYRNDGTKLIELNSDSDEPGIWFTGTDGNRRRVVQ